MAVDVYADRARVVARLPRGQLANPGRRVASVAAGTDTIELDGHGLEDGAEVLVRAEAGGALPAPLMAGTTYYALRQSDATFKLSASSGGGAIDLTTAGSRMVVVEQLEPLIEELSEFYSRWFDTRCIGHTVPFEEPYPPFVIGVVAELVAGKLLDKVGGGNDRSLEREKMWHLEVERWAKAGAPLRDERATAPANLAVARSGSASGTTARDTETIP